MSVMLDWMGSLKMEDQRLQAMRDAGVQVHRYRPLHWPNLSRTNNRTHHKLLVLDGKVAFTGGVASPTNGRAARERGMRILIIVPGEHIDSETVRRTSKAS